MSTSERDRWIKICFPAILTLLIYSWGYARKNSTTLTDARKQLSEFSMLPSSQSALTKKTMELSKLGDQVNDFAARKTAAAGGSGVRKSSVGRTTALKVLTGLAEKSGLVLLEAAPNEMATPMLKVITTISKGVDLPDPQLWRMELAGSYLDMLNMLTELQKIDVFAVPVEVKMEPLKDDAVGPAVRWTLTVWI
jgi:hypothetical protein